MSKSELEVYRKAEARAKRRLIKECEGNIFIDENVSAKHHLAVACWYAVSTHGFYRCIFDENGALKDGAYLRLEKVERRARELFDFIVKYSVVCPWECNHGLEDNET